MSAVIGFAGRGFKRECGTQGVAGAPRAPVGRKKKSPLAQTSGLEWKSAGGAGRSVG